MEDLEEAILVARQAVDVTPKDHPDLAGRLNNLGNKLGRRYKYLLDLANFPLTLPSSTLVESYAGSFSLKARVLDAQHIHCLNKRAEFGRTLVGAIT
jgi:hypothetical protein